MAGNDRIIYKGKIYGNTITTDKAIVATAPNIIDDETEIYTVELPGKTETVEIAGGGRITYGSSNLNTVVCQGLKMTRGNLIDTNFADGFVMPTDLYASFNLKHGFLKKPNIGENAGSGPWVAEDYSLMAAYQTNSSNTQYIYYSLISKDCDPTSINAHYDYMNIQPSTTVPSISKSGYTIFIGRYNAGYDKGRYYPPTYHSIDAASYAATRSSDYTFNLEHAEYGENKKYMGLYFLVSGVSRVGSDDDNGSVYIYKNGDYTNQFVKEDKTICVPTNYSLPQVEGSYTLNNNDIMSVKNPATGKRDFYFYFANAQFGNGILPYNFKSNRLNFKYIGDITTTEVESNTVTRVRFGNDDTIEKILKQAFGDNTVIYTRDTTYNDTDFYVSNINNLINIEAQQFFTVKGYANVKPYFIVMREYAKNKLPDFYIPTDAVLRNYASGTFNVPDKELVSIKNNDNRIFYVYHSNIDKLEEFTMSDFSTAGSIVYHGDVESIPENGNSVTHVDFDPNETIETILHQLFKVNINIIRSNNTGKNGTINVRSNISSLTLASSNIAVYVQSDETDFKYYDLAYAESCSNSGGTIYNLCIPFLNEAELNFAFGERENLQYISEEEYEEIVNTLPSEEESG